MTLIEVAQSDFWDTELLERGIPITVVASFETWVATGFTAWNVVEDLQPTGATLYIVTARGEPFGLFRTQGKEIVELAECPKYATLLMTAFKKAPAATRLLYTRNFHHLWTPGEGFEFVYEMPLGMTV